MKSVPLNACPRSLSRRGGSKQLRESGRIPAVIYGRQVEPQNLEVKSKEIEDLMQRAASETVLVDLQLQDDARPKRLALVQEVQRHPLNGKVIHVDLHEIAETEKVTVSVPVESVGEPEGVKSDGGVLEHVLFAVKLRGLAKELPEILEVDVTALKIGQSIQLGDLKVPAGVEVVGDKHNTVLSVAAPPTEEEVAAATAEAAAVPGEVEMIKEKKEEGEEGAAPAAGEKKGAAAPAAGEKKGAAAPAAGEKKAAAPAAGEKKAGAAEKKKK